VPEKVAKQIVQAFDDYVARPLEANLKNLHGHDLAKRNPMIYTTRGRSLASTRGKPIRCSARGRNWC
jgi:hypothetical protein